VTATTRALSVLPAELPAAVERLQADLKAGAREVRRLQEESAGLLAERLRGQAPTINGVRSVLLTQLGWDAAALKTLAAAIVIESGCVVVLTGDGPPTPVVVARSADVGVDAGAWIKRATGELGGRGGGRPEMAQGGLDAAPEQVIAFARRTLAP
jgi:alanyl-tRNA synthetase